MEDESEIKQKIEKLRNLISNVESNDVLLHAFHELFQSSQSGRNLRPETIDWLNQSSELVLSPKLRETLFKLHLHRYAFLFAGLNLINVEDVIYDLINGDILKSSAAVFPPGARIKLQRELLSIASKKRESFQSPSLEDREADNIQSPELVKSLLKDVVMDFALSRRKRVLLEKLVKVNSKTWKEFLKNQSDDISNFINSFVKTNDRDESSDEKVLVQSRL